MIFVYFSISMNQPYAHHFYSLFYPLCLHFDLFMSIDHFRSIPVTANLPSFRSIEVILCCSTKLSTGRGEQSKPCHSFTELSWLALAKKSPFYSYFTSEINFKWAGIRLSSFFLLKSKIDMRLFFPATANSNPLGAKSEQRIESDC